MQELLKTLNDLARKVFPYYAASLTPPLTEADDVRLPEVITTLASLPEPVLTAMLASYVKADEAEAKVRALATAKGASTSNRMPVMVQAQQRALALRCAEAAIAAFAKVQAEAVENGETPLLAGAYFTLLADGFRWNPVSDGDAVRIETYDTDRANVGVRVNVVGSKAALYRFNGDTAWTEDKAAASRLHSLKRPYVKRAPEAEAGSEAPAKP